MIVPRPAQIERKCAPKKPAPSALRTTARPTGWSRPWNSTCRSIPRRRGCARRSQLKPNPNGGAPAPLVLDGDGLSLVALKLDGAALPAEHYVATPDSLTIAQPPHRPFRLEIETVRRSLGQYPADGPLSLGRDLLHPMRGRGLPPHHLFPRPARRDGGLHHPHRGRARPRRRCCSPTAISWPSGDVPGTAAISRSGTIRSPSPPICSRWSAASSAASRTASAPCRAATSTLRIYVEPGKEDRCGYAMDSLKRAMRWDEEAFGREYDLDIFMIVAVSDFNMGAMENKGLNVFNDKYVLASPETATDDDFDAHRGDHRARIFPQLDRQPHHLPRLVPALPQGRAHRLPRPGVLRRRALARGRAHQRRARPARASVRRGCRPPRPSGAARRSITRSTTSTPRPSTRRAPRSCACSRRCSARRISARAWTSTSTAMTARPRRSRSSCNASPMRPAPTSTQFMLWYSQAGTPEVVVTGSYDARAKTYRLDVAQTRPADAGPARRRSRW